MTYLLGVDLGTSGTKTVLFDAEGREVSSQSVEYPLYQPQNGWAEQDPRDWWNAAVSTIRGVLEKSGVNPGDVKGLGISGQMHGLVLLDVSAYWQQTVIGAVIILAVALDNLRHMKKKA